VCVCVETCTLSLLTYFCHQLILCLRSVQLVKVKVKN